MLSTDREPERKREVLDMLVLLRQLYFSKCMACVAVLKIGIISPYWFEDENERPQTMNMEHYVDVKQSFRHYWDSVKG